MKLLLWTSAALLVYAQAGYGVLLWLLGRGRLAPDVPAPVEPLPRVSLIVAAYREEKVIAAKVANALAQDWPRERLEVIVAVDGGAEAGADRTAQLAREAGADVVLELGRSGKMRAQDAAVRAATGDLLAFSDANATWAHDALRRLAGAFTDPAVAYACGEVTFLDAGGTNQEGLYWRYELFLRTRESALHSVTAGNGAIYAVRRRDYVVPDVPMGHDLFLPFTLVRRGRRAVFVPQARASERMVADIEGEWARKRRMMLNAWPIILRGGLFDPRGFPPVYLGLLVSHRWLRYLSPFLHLIAFGASLALARRPLYAAAAAAQAALVGAAVAGGRVRSRPLLLARYYVLTTASIAAGLADHLRHGTPQGWEPPEETR